MSVINPVANVPVADSVVKSGFWQSGPAEDRNP
jgi:hypothetical protein